MSAPTITLEGRVVGDVRFKFTDDTALPVARFRMVCVDRKRQGDQWVDGEEFWVTVSCFRTLAENVMESVMDRDQVIVIGKLTTAEWFDVTGEKKSAPKIVASNVGVSLMFGARPATDTTGRTRQAAPQRAPQRAQVPAGGPVVDPQGSDESWGVSEPWTGPGTADDPWA